MITKATVESHRRSGLGVAIRSPCVGVNDARRDAVSGGVAAWGKVGVCAAGFAAHVEVRPPRKRPSQKKALPQKALPDTEPPGERVDSHGGRFWSAFFTRVRAVSGRMRFVRWLPTRGVGKSLEQLCSGKEEGARGFQRFEIVST